MSQGTSGTWACRTDDIDPDAERSEEAESKKHTVLDEGVQEQIDVDDKEANTKLGANDLQYLLADKSWKEAIINYPEADKIIGHLVNIGFEKPSKIQSKTIPFALAKRSLGIIAQSNNGSGKTLAFVLPAVLGVDLNKPLMKSQKTYLPQAIIIAPNVELCAQIMKIAQNVAEPFPDLKVSRGKDAAHIVVGTPQGVRNLISKRQIELTNLDLLALDEADDSLQGETGGHVNTIIAVLPKKCGLFFFSATYTQESIDYMNAFFSRQNLKFVLRYILKSEELKLDGIRQFAKRCDPRKKADYIDKLLNNLETDMQFIIFANTKKFAQEVYEELKNRGHEIALLMGGQRPEERSDILNAFIQGQYKTLMTTNLLARGFDQRTIGLVINLDIPKQYGENRDKVDRDTYLHRIGRTGRFGDQGLVVNLYARDDERQMLESIEKYYKVEMQDLGKKDDLEEFKMLNDLLDQIQKNNHEKRATHGERNMFNYSNPKKTIEYSNPTTEYSSPKKTIEYSNPITEYSNSKKTIEYSNPTTEYSNPKKITEYSSPKKTRVIEDEEVKKDNKDVDNRQKNEQKKDQWQWKGDDGWTNYDTQTNEKIAEAFYQKQNLVNIKFLPSKTPGTHIIDLKNSSMTSKTTKDILKIRAKNDIWYEEDDKMDQDVAEFISLKKLQDKESFEIFMNQYTIDLKQSKQINKRTKYEREIRYVPMPEQKALKNSTVEQDFIPGPPSLWEKMPENTNFRLVKLNPAEHKEEWETTTTLFNNTLSHKEIKSVHRIQNVLFWDEYCRAKLNALTRRRYSGLNSDDVKELSLWHGTSNIHPEVIFKDMDESFNLNYAQQGLWGKALYFAENASYSDSYAYSNQGATKLFILCQVLVGDCIELNQNNEILEPPKREGYESLRYESVKGYTGGSVVYMLYVSKRAYPKYLVEYK